MKRGNPRESRYHKRWFSDEQKNKPALGDYGSWLTTMAPSAEAVTVAPPAVMDYYYWDEMGPLPSNPHFTRWGLNRQPKVDVHEEL